MARTRISRTLTAALLMVSALGAAAPAQAAGPEGGRLLATIRFDKGAELGAEAQRELLAASKELEGKTDLALFLIGHTDDRGTNAANLVLGKERVGAVKDWLVKHGVADAGIKLASRGEEEPIKVGTTPEIRALNRRVEIWIASKTAEVVARSDRPFAWISWLYRDVAARRPETTDWTPAKPKMPLEKLYRVRTSERSATEVTFRTEDQLYLGQQALVVIYGEDEKAKRAKARVADVTVEEGALFARLSHVEAPLAVETKAAVVKVKSRSSRVAHEERRKASTVAVYDGAAEVTAKGKTVPLAGGFGTRVKTGSVPEAPTKLVPPPAWVTPSGGTTFAPLPVGLAWRYTDTSSVALVEFSSALEDGPNRPLESVRAAGPQRDVELATGAYVARPRAVDAREIPGPLGDAITFVVLDPPTDAATGAVVPTKNGALHLAKPGKVRFTAPAGTSIGVGGGDSPIGPTADANLPKAGKSKIEYRLVRSDGRVIARSSVDAEVDAAPVEAVVAEKPAQTPIRPVQHVEAAAEGPATVWPMAQLLGGIQVGPHEIEPMLGLFLGATVRLGETARLDFGPWVGWYQAQLQKPAAATAPANVFPFELRAALAMDLGAWRPYLGGSGGVQLVRLTKDARDLGIVTDAVQPAWNVFLGAGITAGPGAVLVEIDYGVVSLKGDDIGDKIGGPAFLVGYRFGAR